MKASYPIQTAEYAVANCLTTEPAFVWWVLQTLKSRDRIIKQFKAQVKRKPEKFGIEIPTNVERALEIDRETNTSFWQNALAKEMGNIHPAIELLPEKAKPPPGYAFIRCHIIFDVKMDFTCKARFVAGGHMTDPLTMQTYASVVTRKSVCLALL
ncbi:hypothetical protein ACA910_018563 [Epithemia clementina (nom. ined.)]